MKDERFIVTYRIEANTYEDAKSIAWAVQVEQTIEFPYEFVTDPYIKNTMLYLVTHRYNLIFGW